MDRTLIWTVAFAVVIVCSHLVCSSVSHAEIYRWDTDEVIPGTEEIEPGPGVQFRAWASENRNLRYADFSGGVNLTGAFFGADWGNYGDWSFRGSWLDHADFSNANLTSASFASFDDCYPHTSACFHEPGARLTNANLTGANLTMAWLTDATLENAILIDANLSGAVLTYADLIGANFTGSIVSGTFLNSTTSGGFTKEQLYSTASYQTKDLHGVQLTGNDLSGWDFRGQDLTNASLSAAGTDLTDAIVTRAYLAGISEEQFRSTANYQEKNFRGIRLSGNDLTGWNLEDLDFSDVDLRRSILANTNLTNTNLAGAFVSGASFRGAIGLTPQQFSTTASYQTKNLRGVVFDSFDLTGWSLTEQDLTNARFIESTLVDTSFSRASLSDSTFNGADLSGANLGDASIDGTSFDDANLTRAILTGVTSWRCDWVQVWEGIYEEYCYSSSLRRANLTSATLAEADLTGAYLTDANLTEADLTGSKLAARHYFGIQGDFWFGDLTNAKLTGANLTNADLSQATLVGGDLRNAIFLVNDPQSVTYDATTIYNQWTVFPTNFDPVAAGLTLMSSMAGDLDANDVLDGADIDSLATRIRNGAAQPPWLSDAMFDVNGDSAVNDEDYRTWVKDVADTWFGDANLDGEFDVSDFERIFEAGKYETQQYATWGEGDWNGDGIFDSDDFIAAFIDGGYEKGPRTNAVAVPEPRTWPSILLALVCVLRRQPVCQIKSH
jgi:uncharacterized protein YjbI with pentapeptide repeats